MIIVKLVILFSLLAHGRDVPTLKPWQIRPQVQMFEDGSYIVQFPEITGWAPVTGCFENWPCSK